MDEYFYIDKRTDGLYVELKDNVNTLFGLKVLPNKDNPTFQNCSIGILLGEHRFKMSAETFLYGLITSTTIPEKNVSFVRHDLFTLRISINGERYTIPKFHQITNHIRNILTKNYGYYKLQKIRYKKYMKDELNLYLNSYREPKIACKNYAHYCFPKDFNYKEFISDLDNYKADIQPKWCESGGEHIGFFTDEVGRIRPLTSRKEYTLEYLFEDLFAQKLFSTYN